MRIIYFTHFFKPEFTAASFRATDHSRDWVNRGHEVTVFTGWPNSPNGILHEGYVVEELGKEEINGVHVFRSASKIEPYTSFKTRIECGVSFILNGMKNLSGNSPVGTNFDVAVVTSGTVFAAWLGVHFAKRHKIPLVVEFRDLTYKQLIASGNPESSPKVKAMKALELSYCKAADKVVVLTKGFRDDLVAEGVPADIISIVPNGADIVPCEHSWGKRLRLGFFGNMGLSQNVPSTLDYIGMLAAKGLAESYLLIGEGAARASVVEAMDKAADGFLKLQHGIPKDELEPYYAAVDMTVSSLQKDENFKGSIPSKIFQSFARGVPVLFIGPEGDASRLVRESGAGLALCGSRKEDLAALEAFASRDDLVQELSRMSEAAVDFMERNYTRKHLADQMLGVLLETSK